MIFQLIQVFDNPSLKFRGNTSVVILLEKPISGEKMQQIAADQLQPATTFLWPAEGENEYNVRWFAPDAEIGLCGHGTAAAGAFLENLHDKKGKFSLHYKDGSLEVETLPGSAIRMSLPMIPVLHELEVPEAIMSGLNIPIKGFYATDNKYIILTDNEECVKMMKPDFSKLRESGIFGYAVTAEGDTADFVSRTLVPHVHQLEDPATGSSHAALFPFWKNKLGKTKMEAYQLSIRGGHFSGEVNDNTVLLTGHYKLLATGKIIG